MSLTVSSTDLYRFYEDLVRKLRERGVVCAITSGMACVHYGIAETTKDCDLLCHPDSFGVLLDLLEATRIQEVTCCYRGNISPPLEARWHAGGWTSHFEWQVEPDAITLDIFGRALRESSFWEHELLGLYAGPQTVAEMKRTHRDKDWACVTALGVRMIEAEDERGWWHIFDVDTLADLLNNHPCPSELAARRPALALALDQDPRSAGALNAERKFWEELDRRRIHILERYLRPYVAAVRRARSGKTFLLREEHGLRIDCATRCLPQNPLKDYGLQKFLDEAAAAIVDTGLVPASALTWLPEVKIHFEWLNR